MYAAAKLKENITIDDLNRQPLLVAHVSPSRLDDFPLSETPALFAALSSSSPGLTVQTVRVTLLFRFVNIICHFIFESGTRVRNTLEKLHQVKYSYFISFFF